MKIIDESDLRAGLIPQGTKEYRVANGCALTPLAKEYLASRGIEVVCCKIPTADAVATEHAKKYKRYTDAATGQSLAEKPEYMTQICGNLLVSKAHPRIELRGRLDSLESKILEVQIAAKRAGKEALYADLNEVLSYVREVLAAEVKDKIFVKATLFGLDEDGLRRVSHNTKDEFGFTHPVPDAAMGESAVLLNSLRTQARECELSAVRAFGSGRVDIVRALNRLSSGIYILFCREIAGRYR